MGLGRNHQFDTELQRDVTITYDYGFDEKGTASGKLVRLDLVADDETQVRHAIIEIKDDLTPITPGELVNVSIPGDAHPAAFWLPEQALHQRSEVITVANDRLTPLQIKLLETRGNQILVAGLEAGTPIVIEKPFWSGPGTVVSIKSDQDEQQAQQDKTADKENTGES